MVKTYKSVYVSTVTYDRLKFLQHPGQSFDGVIVELLNNHTNDKAKDVPPERDRNKVNTP